MEHYITLFDSLFLPQGIALHRSMQRHAGIYTLWVLCVDDIAYEVLTQLELPNLRLIKLSDVETDELRQVKKDRTRAEYCWTLTPFTPHFVFKADGSVQRVTYVDADLWFRKSPTPIFKEFEESGKQVLITEHAFAPEYDQSATCGVYCVQFITFTRQGGELVRKWWEESCIEWCYARVEDGKFGDQKYLDDWPEIFSEKVHVLAQLEFLLAPWNGLRFPYSKAIAYHFHGLRLMESGYILLGGKNFVPTVVVRYIYQAYLLDIKQAVDMQNQIGYAFKPQVKFGILHKFRLKTCETIFQFLRRARAKRIQYLKVIVKSS